MDTNILMVSSQTVELVVVEPGISSEMRVVKLLAQVEVNLIPTLLHFPCRLISLCLLYSFRSV